jgi:DNA-binding response OmpR family regulator
METHTACIPADRALQMTACQGSIVVVEDPFIQKYVRDLLARYGYRVLKSDAGAVAGMLRSAVDPVDLVITNSPRDFLTFADSLPILYMAAAPDLELASRFLCCQVLRKPFHPDQLLACVKELTGSL